MYTGRYSKGGGCTISFVNVGLLSVSRCADIRLFNRSCHTFAEKTAKFGWPKGQNYVMVQTMLGKREMQGGVNNHGLIGPRNRSNCGAHEGTLSAVWQIRFQHNSLPELNAS